MPKPPTVEDVARLAGVSRQTVSNVLNAPGVVRVATRQRVRAAIDQLGYRPSAAARRLRTQRSSTIAIQLDPYRGGIAGALLDRFLHALTSNADSRGLRVLLYTSDGVEDEIRRLAALAEGQEMDAVILTGTTFDDPRQLWLSQNGINFVSFGRPWGLDVWNSEHSWVDVDGAAGVAAATEYALSRWGNRVLWFGWLPDGATGDDRESGWRRVVDSRGLAVVALRCEDTVQAAQLTLTEFLDGSQQEFDAIVCASDSLAVGAQLALAQSRRFEVGVVGFDNTPVAEALGLSSVEQCPELVAESVLRMITDESGRQLVGFGSSPPGRELIQPRVIERAASLLGNPS